MMDIIDAKWIEDRLTGRRGEKADLARHVGVKPDIITKILSGDRRVQPEEMTLVASFFNGDAGPTQVVRGDPAPDGTDLVPVYDVDVSAGYGSLTDAEEHVSNLAFSSQYLREMTNAKGQELAVIRVKGDSMAPSIQDDDMVMVDRTKANLDFDGLFVMRVGESLHVKRIGRGSRRSTVMVISDNTLYPSVDTERSEIEVIGKVIWHGRKV